MPGGAWADNTDYENAFISATDLRPRTTARDDQAASDDLDAHLVASVRLQPPTTRFTLPRRLVSLVERPPDDHHHRYELRLDVGIFRSSRGARQECSDATPRVDRIRRRRARCTTSKSGLQQAAQRRRLRSVARAINLTATAPAAARNKGSATRSRDRPHTRATTTRDGGGRRAAGLSSNGARCSTDERSGTAARAGRRPRGFSATSAFDNVLAVPRRVAAPLLCETTQPPGQSRLEMNSPPALPGQWRLGNQNARRARTRRRHVHRDRRSPRAAHPDRDGDGVKTRPTASPTTRTVHPGAADSRPRVDANCDRRDARAAAQVAPKDLLSRASDADQDRPLLERRARGTRAPALLAPRVQGVDETVPGRSGRRTYVVKGSRRGSSAATSTSRST